MACKHPPLPNKPGKTNWIEKAGGLPEMIDCVARALHHERGKSVSNAIQIAVGTVKDWAAGRRGATQKTQMKARAAIARWEAMKAKS